MGVGVSCMASLLRLTVWVMGVVSSISPIPKPPIITQGSSYKKKPPIGQSASYLSGGVRSSARSPRAKRRSARNSAPKSALRRLAPSKAPLATSTAEDNSPKAISPRSARRPPYLAASSGA